MDEGIPPPTETVDLRWTAGSKTRLQWTATAGATSYTVYEGGRATLPALLNANPDSCIAAVSVTTSIGSTSTHLAPAGGLLW